MPKTVLIVEDNALHMKMLKADDELKHIPVIAVTAFALKGDEQKFHEAGRDDYIAKPISVAGFLDKVANLLT